LLERGREAPRGLSFGPRVDLTARIREPGARERGPVTRETGRRSRASLPESGVFVAAESVFAEGDPPGEGRYGPRTVDVGERTVCL
jgi:hypothetical protein